MGSKMDYALSDTMRHDDYEDDENEALAEIASAPHWPLGHVLLRCAGLLRSTGLLYPSDQLLGSGKFGAAFKIPALGGSVLKITRDPTEVQAACLLVGRRVERIVPVHGVWYLREGYVPGFQRWFVVHRGLLHPLTALDKALIEMIFALYDDVDLDLVIPRSAGQHATLSKWRTYIRRELMDGWEKRTDHEGNTFGNGPLQVGRHVKQAMRLLVQIGAAVDEMHRAGVDWEDIHSDNWMRTVEGRLAIADIGFGLMHQDFERTVLALTPQMALRHFGAPHTSAGASL